MLWKIITVVLGLLCLLYYGSLCLLLRKWNSTFSRFWLFSGCVLIIFSVTVRKEELWYIVFSVLTVLILSVFLTGAVILRRAYPKGVKEGQCRYLVVLGAHVQGTKVTDSLERRLKKAIEYASEHPETEIIVSGGQGKGEAITEAEAMETYLLKNGISGERIIKEMQSKTTEENLKFSRQYIHNMADKTAVVSNDFHVYRACCYAKKAGYEMIEPLAATTNPRLFVNYMVRECFAVWRMWLHI
ncbi:MAG: YdcF family protein [Lachnospiraceae bacterium]